MRLRSALFCLAVFVVAGASAQTPAAPVSSPSPRLSDTPLPKDPAAALDLLRKVNGLGEDTKPWHVHATYQTFDDQGKASGTGSFEMWWASATKYKQVFVSDLFNQTVYGTEKYPVRTGYPFSAPYPESFLDSEIVHPFSAAAEFAGARLDPRELTLGTVKVRCTMIWHPFSRDAYPPIGLFPTYCSSLDKPILRLSLENASNQISRNKIVLFRDEYIARQIDITDQGKPLMNITVDQIETLPETPDTFFVPPSDAHSVDLRPTAGLGLASVPGMTPGHIISKVTPVYPAEAKQNRIEGEVVLRANITRDGRVRDIDVVTTPNPAMALSAIQAVLQWRYSPYLFNGMPIELRTQIHVNYRIGR